MKRIADEQIHVEGETVSVKLRDEAKGTALANPHDPDARFDGYREAVGYQVQITETCGESKNDANPRIITQVEINQANTANATTLVSGLEKLDAVGLKPVILLTDNGYASDENAQAAAKMGVTHMAPPGGEAPDGFGVVDFALDEEAHTIDHCPMGQTCSENRVIEKHEKTISYFSLETCRACPHSYDCPVKITKRKAKLEWEWKRPRLELRRLAHEEDPTLKKLYKQRAGGESTNAELKNSMGLERIRRRGFEATKLVVFLAATALNIRRMHGWLRRKALEQLSNIDSMLAKWLVLKLL